MGECLFLDEVDITLGIFAHIHTERIKQSLEFLFVEHFFKLAVLKRNQS